MWFKMVDGEQSLLLTAKERKERKRRRADDEQKKESRKGRKSLKKSNGIVRSWNSVAKEDGRRFLLLRDLLLSARA